MSGKCLFKILTSHMNIAFSSIIPHDYFYHKNILSLLHLRVKLMLQKIYTMLFCGLLCPLVRCRTLRGLCCSQLEKLQHMAWWTRSYRCVISLRELGCEHGCLGKPQYTAGLCRTVMHQHYKNCCLLPKMQTIFLFLEMNFAAEYQVILFGRAGWKGCLRGDTDGKIHMGIGDSLQWDIFVLNISAMSSTS